MYIYMFVIQVAVPSNGATVLGEHAVPAFKSVCEGVCMRMRARTCVNFGI